MQNRKSSLGQSMAHELEHKIRVSTWKLKQQTKHNKQLFGQDV